MTEQDRPNSTDRAGGLGEPVQIAVHADPGHRPPGHGAELVEQALDSAGVAPGTPVSVSVPAGDAEMVFRARDLLAEEEVRRAGATTIVDGIVPEQPATGN